MMEIKIQTQLNLSKNVIISIPEKSGRFEIDSERGQWLDIPAGATMNYFEGNFSSMNEAIDKVEELTDRFRHSDYKVLIDGEDVTSHF